MARMIQFTDGWHEVKIGMVAGWDGDRLVAPELRRGTRAGRRPSVPGWRPRPDAKERFDSTFIPGVSCQQRGFLPPRCPPCGGSELPAVAGPRRLSVGAGRARAPGFAPIASLRGIARRRRRGVSTLAIPDTAGARPVHLAALGAVARTVNDGLLIATALVAVVFSLVQWATPGIIGIDGYYHIKVSRLMLEQGWRILFPLTSRGFSSPS